MRKGYFLGIPAASILLACSFPRPDAGVLSLLALVPLFLGVAPMRIQGALIGGWAAGTLWFFVSYNWVSHSVTTFGGIPLPLAEAVILLLAGIHGLYVGLFSILIPVVSRRGEKGRRAGKDEGADERTEGPAPSSTSSAASFLQHPVIPLLVLPSAWVLLEVMRSWFPAPFPWLLLGTAMWNVPFLGPLYEVVGVYGVSFWIVMVNAQLWIALRVDKDGRKKAGILLAAVLLLPLFLYPVRDQTTGQKMRVGVVQGNFEQEVKWQEELVDETIRTYLSLTQEAFAKGAQLVLWPETAVPVYYQADPDLIRSLKQFVSVRDIHLVFGSPGFEIEGRKVLLYNRVYHLAPGGGEESYDKIMLVPFGEYVPLGKLMPFIDRLVPGEGEFSRGAWKGPFQTPVPSGALVCYEISFPSLARREVRDGAKILLNVTNDAWFGRSWGPYQHLAVSTVRARENRVPILRAANTGVSAIIDRDGRVVKSIPLDVRGVIVADIETGAGHTFYTRFGDWIVILCAAVLSVYFLVLFFLWRSGKWTLKHSRALLQGPATN